MHSWEIPTARRCGLHSGYQVIVQECAKPTFCRLQSAGGSLSIGKMGSAQRKTSPQVLVSLPLKCVAPHTQPAFSLSLGLLTCKIGQRHHFPHRNA